MTEVKHENHFLFDMVVPISSTKVVHQASSNPQPIVVEKLTGKYVTPSQSFQGHMTQVVQQEQLGAFGGSKNHFCPRDTMNQAVLLAQLDMKKKKRDPDAALPPTVAKSGATEKMPKSLKTKQWSQVHEVSNKPKKNASVQITCVSNKRKSPEPTPLSQLPATTNSPPTHDKEPGIGCLQDIERLQGDICKQITEMRDLLENLVKECNNPKSFPPEEDQEPPDPSHEQGALRSITRQVYIVQQQIADVERKLNVMHNYKTTAHVYANKMNWAKSRLTSAYRGAYKSLQGMTNHLRRFAGSSADPVFQLRLVDLLSQLLQSIHRLLDIYLQLTNNCNSNSPELLELVDMADALQAEWQAKLKYKLKQLMSTGVQGSTTSPGSSKKKTKSIQKNPRQQLSSDVMPEKKSILRTASEPSNLSRGAHKITKKPPTTKKNTKSVIFSAQVQAHRKPHEVSNQNGYAQPTLSSRMKSLSDLKPEEKSEPLEPRQSPQTSIAENREQPSSPPPSSSSVLLPGFGSQQFVFNSKSKIKNIGESIIEELLTLESKQQEKQEGKCSSTTVNDTWHADNQQSKSDVRFTDEGFKSVDLNLPPLEVLLHRLQEMEKEEIQIRSRWASSRYYDMEAATEECFKAKGSLTTANHQPHSPSPIIFSKKTDTQQTFEIFQEQPRRHSSGEFPGSIRFTKKAGKSTFQEMQIEDDEQKADDDSGNQRIQLGHQQKQKITNLDYQGRKPKRLFLSNKILKNITENRQRFSNYLLNSAYHQVESFDPWHLTEELADSILEDCIQEVSEEMQDLSHDLVHHLFNNEFIQFSPPSTIQPPLTKMLDISE